jgi:hypothetical protein
MAGDTNFYQVTLLLHGEGIDGTTNIVDNSGYAKGSTTTPGVTISTSQFKFGSSSIKFAGTTGNRIIIPLSTEMYFGTGDYTVECWAYFTSIAQGHVVGHVQQGINAMWMFYITGGAYISWYDSATSTGYPSNTPLTTNTWIHLAVTRASGTQRVFQNGVLVNTATNNSNYYSGSSGARDMTIGCDYGGNAGSTMNGYLDDLRITKGFARYTAAFTPHTSTHPDGAGQISGKVYSEDAGYTPGSLIDPYYNQVSLLLHCEGTNGSTTLTDTSHTPRVVTVSGNAQISTAQSKFGGSSLYFDGTGDYVSAGSASDWTFMHLADARWTFESWVRVTSFAAVNTIVSTSNGSTVDTGIYCAIAATTRVVNLQVFRGVAASYVVTGNFATAFPNDSAWHHLAITWDHSLASSNATLWIDGVPYGTLNKTANTPATLPATAPLKLGGYDAVGNFNGYMDDIRVTKDLVRYTSNFTAPAAAFADQWTTAGGAVSRRVRAYSRITGALAKEVFTGPGDPYYNQVSLLLHAEGYDGSTAILDSSCAPKVVTAYGNARIRTSQAKFGDSSLYFDGNGDYIAFADTPALRLGSSDFTLEAWVYLTGYPTNNSGYYQSTVCAKDLSGAREFGFHLKGTSSSFTDLTFLGFSTNSVYTEVTQPFAFTLNTWYHLAVVRSGNLVFLCVNGSILNAGGTAFAQTLQGTTTPFKIGAVEYDASFKYYLNGYIDELRITKGVARYTTNFTPATERSSDRVVGNRGEYSMWVPTPEEHVVMCMDDSAGVFYNDMVHRVIPA